MFFKNDRHSNRVLISKSAIPHTAYGASKKNQYKEFISIFKFANGLHVRKFFSVQICFKGSFVSSMVSRLRSFSLGAQGVNLADVSTDNRYVAVQKAWDEISVWCLKTQAIKATFKTDCSTLKACFLRKDCAHLLLVLTKLQFILICTKKMKILSKAFHKIPEAFRLCVDDANNIVTSDFYGAKVSFWKILRKCRLGRNEDKSQMDLSQHGMQLHDLVITPDGKRLFCIFSYLSNVLKIVDTDTGDTQYLPEGVLRGSFGGFSVAHENAVVSFTSKHMRVVDYKQQKVVSETLSPAWLEEDRCKMSARSNLIFYRGTGPYSSVVRHTKGKETVIASVRCQKGMFSFDDNLLVTIRKEFAEKDRIVTAAVCKWSDKTHHLFGNGFRRAVFMLMCCKQHFQKTDKFKLPHLPLQQWLTIFYYFEEYYVRVTQRK